MSVKILFLDIDGVLNNEAVFKDLRFGPFPLDYLAIEHLHKVIGETGAKIVLSSSWRDVPHLERKLVGDMVFHTLDGVDARHEDGSTKRLWTTRGDEIAEWLGRHPEVTRYAIVDDDSDMLPEQLPYFVQTSTQIGLTKNHITSLIRILNS